MRPSLFDALTFYIFFAIRLSCDCQSVGNNEIISNGSLAVLISSTKSLFTILSVPYGPYCVIRKLEYVLRSRALQSGLIIVSYTPTTGLLPCNAKVTAVTFAVRGTN